jgi:hypothetical protein
MIRLLTLLFLLFISDITHCQDNNINDTIPLTVFVQFETTKEGKVTNVKIHKVEGGPCSESELEEYKKEAIRVVSESSNFKRKKQKFILPIKFETE